MISKNIILKNFYSLKKNKKIKLELNKILDSKNEVINSLKKEFRLNYDLKKLKIKKKFNLRIIGIGGSILGAKAIFSFLSNTIKKKISFIDNLEIDNLKQTKKNFTNLIISKSGNTLETIVNSNLLIKKNDQNIFLTEQKKNYLNSLAQKLKSEVISHNNFIGGRYSVLSETGMLPAELMGLDVSQFKQLNSLVKNPNFLRALVNNVSSTLHFLKKKKFNYIIINYDPKSEDLLKWYQQLIAESLGKNNQGILPIISTMPKDNHSVMQLFLDGFKNNFFTFFFVNELRSPKINSNSILLSHKFLKNKNLNQILFAQKVATEQVFKDKNIPFRSFQVMKRDEKSLGELFCFFILETILLAKMLKINPYDQPAVELIKIETKKKLI
jgi:glucose-6-phosphate isomerase